jgi:AraC-like DNA-binding protein
MRLLKGCRRLTVLFDRSALEHQLSLLVNQEINKPLIFNLEMGDANGCRSTWLNSLLYLCEQFSLSNRTTGNEPYLWHANNMLMSLLLEIQPHNYSHLLSRDEKANSPKFVRRAIAYIEEHVRQPISLTELASFAGTSTRTLQRGFLKYTGKNPCEYIRLVKVHAVYEALKAACPGSQVSDILYDYGISSFGHFTRAYKGVYGCTPSETLNK